MTRKDLSHHLALREDLAKAQKRLKRLYDKAYPGAQKLSGMPHASGISDKVGDLGIEIADYETFVDELKREVEQSAKEVAAFIATIDDPNIRLYFRLYYLRGMVWKQVADCCGEDISESTVKNEVYKWARKNNF